MLRPASRHFNELDNGLRTKGFANRAQRLSLSDVGLLQILVTPKVYTTLLSESREVQSSMGGPSVSSYFGAVGDIKDIMSEFADEDLRGNKRFLLGFAALAGFSTSCPERVSRHLDYG